MPTRTVVRSVSEGDLPGLQRLYRHLIEDNPELDAAKAADIWRALLDYEGSDIFIAIAEGVLVASCTLIVIPNLTRGGTPYALIENVVTHARYRRKGHGKAVLEAAIDAAWSADCYKVMLMTGSKRPETLAFYDSVGFERTKTGFETRRLPKREQAHRRTS